MKKYSMLVCVSIILCLLGNCQNRTTPDEPGIIENSVASTDGVSIHYQVRGKGTPALVFIHGWCCDLTYWEKQWAPFVKKYTVVSIDLAGHGESGTDRESWTISAFGEDVVAVIKNLELDQVVLIGHSMGGLVILEAAKHIPNQVLGLVGVDTLQDLEQKWTKDQFDQHLSPYHADYAGTMKNVVRSMFTPDSNPAFVERIVADMSSAPPEIGIAAFEEYFNYWSNSIVRTFKETKAPITCINSDKYPSNPQGNRKLNSSYRLKVMTGVGHFIMLESPEIFNRLLEETIQEFIGGPAQPANHADVSSIDALVEALYESITFPEGEKPDLERFESLFHPNAPFIRITPDGPNIMDLDSFVSSFRRRVETGALKSFYEAEISRKTHSYGGIAHVFSTYKKGVNTTDPRSWGRGINSIQLFHDGNRWWACGINWEDERDTNPIPNMYLK